MMWRLYCSLSEPYSDGLKCVACPGIMVCSGTRGSRAHSESIGELCRAHSNKLTVVLCLRPSESYLSKKVFPEPLSGCVSEGAILFSSKGSLNNIYAVQSGDQIWQWWGELNYLTVQMYPLRITFKIIWKDSFQITCCGPLNPK